SPLRTSWRAARRSARGTSALAPTGRAIRLGLAARLYGRSVLDRLLQKNEVEGAGPFSGLHGAVNLQSFPVFRKFPLLFYPNLAAPPARVSVSNQRELQFAAVLLRCGFRGCVGLVRVTKLRGRFTAIQVVYGVLRVKLVSGSISLRWSLVAGSSTPTPAPRHSHSHAWNAHANAPH